MTDLRLQRSFDAAPDEVFDAWTSPEVLRRWWAVGPTWDTPVAEVDLRVGGRYRLSMHDPDSDETHTVVGEYREVERPDRLVYTWTWEGEGPPVEGSRGSVVTVEFLGQNGGTTVVITHTGFSGEEVKEMHAHGWNGCLDNLARVLVTAT